MISDQNFQLGMKNCLKHSTNSKIVSMKSGRLSKMFIFLTYSKQLQATVKNVASYLH